jgi:hypothetical protein
VGNVIYSFYVFSLPLGPAWGIHAFNLIVGLLMLTWWMRYSRRQRQTSKAGVVSLPASIGPFVDEPLAELTAAGR